MLDDPGALSLPSYYFRQGELLFEICDARDVLGVLRVTRDTFGAAQKIIWYQESNSQCAHTRQLP